MLAINTYLMDKVRGFIFDNKKWQELVPERVPERVPRRPPRECSVFPPPVHPSRVRGLATCPLGVFPRRPPAERLESASAPRALLRLVLAPLV